MSKCVIDIETESLEPWLGRIISIAIKGTDDKEVRVFYDENEEEMLKAFMDYFHKRNFSEIIGYNVSFDIRYIFGRCMKYGIGSNGFFKASITDLMQIMKTGPKFWGSFNKPGKLEDWLQLIGSGKMKIPESVGSLYEKGKISEILLYNKVDVEETYRLWKHVQKVFYNG